MLAGSRFRNLRLAWSGCYPHDLEFRSHGGIIGGSGTDNITGSSGSNGLSGGSGSDVILGGGGSDRIEGGLGNDRLTGGSGADIFVHKPGFGNDVITDFDANPRSGQDLLDITAYNITAEDFATAIALSDVGADTLVTIGGDPSQTILLAGIDDASVITAQDFLL